VGIDQAYVLDDGKPRTPLGRASRSLALTNAPHGEHFIPLWDGEAHQPVEASWDRVSTVASLWSPH
jgi:hypothetical protein